MSDDLEQVYIVLERTPKYSDNIPEQYMDEIAQHTDFTFNIFGSYTNRHDALKRLDYISQKYHFDFAILEIHTTFHDANIKTQLFSQTLSKSYFITKGKIYDEDGRKMQLAGDNSDSEESECESEESDPKDDNKKQKLLEK